MKVAVGYRNVWMCFLASVNEVISSFEFIHVRDNRMIDEAIIS